jgi:sugar phosphate permease
VPLVLRESVVRDGLRHFDLAGAFSATGAVMLFVYALTLTTSHGWADPLTLSVLTAALGLGVAFVLNERRAAAPLLPLAMFRIRTFAVGNAVTTIVASIAFSEFFLLTLYLQDVLGYSAVETGLAFSAIAVTIAVVSNIAQSLVTRFGPRGVLTVGLVLVTVSLALIARLPVPGSYSVDLLVPFVLNGIGFALCFIPVTIAGLAGVAPAQAGAASGLLNTSRQVGGAVGLAVVNTIAAGSIAEGTAGLAHGFRISLLVLAGMALLGAVLSSTLLAPSPERDTVRVADEPVREAA